MGKCLFFDADGTILDIVKGTPEDTKLALQQLSKRTFVSLAFCLAGIFALYGQEENQNNYGVDEANTKFSLQSGVLGGETNYTYLSLKDHEDVSGVPLGGIGVGNINFAPSGKIGRASCRERV